jgi:hypothetical protein
MKILSIPNQNSNNRPVAFGGFKSLVAGRSMREDNQFIALALRLTKRDLRDFQTVFRAFPNKKLDNDILHISVTGFDGNIDSPHAICINHNDTYGTDRLLPRFTRKILELLSRVTRARKIVTPIKDSEEAGTMMKALMGDTGYTFNEDEIKTWDIDIHSVACTLEDIINKSAPSDGTQPLWYTPLL